MNVKPQRRVEHRVYHRVIQRVGHRVDHRVIQRVGHRVAHPVEHRVERRIETGSTFLSLLLGVITCGLTLLSAQASFAWGIPDVLEDPLLTQPPILAVGPSLPDQARIVCPPAVDVQQALGLSDVIDLALCNNPRIKQAWAGIKIQASAVGEARAAYLPKLNATYSPQQTQTNYPEFSAANTTTTGHMAYASLNWRLFDFGGREANSASANLLLQAALATHDASIQKSMATVIGNYFDVLTANATRKAKTQAVQFAKASWESSIRRERKGVADKSDTLQAQTALAKAELASARAGGDYRKALASLVFTMGLPTESKLVISEQQEPIEHQGLKDLDAWLDEAQRLHPAIKTARAQ